MTHWRVSFSRIALLKFHALCLLFLQYLVSTEISRHLSDKSYEIRKEKRCAEDEDDSADDLSVDETEAVTPTVQGRFVRPNRNDLVLSLSNDRYCSQYSTHNDKYKEEMHSRFRAMGVQSSRLETDKLNKISHEVLRKMKGLLVSSGRLLKCEHPKRKKQKFSVMSDEEALKSKFYKLLGYTLQL